MYYAPPRAASGGIDLLRRTILTLTLLTLFLTAGSAFADAGAELYPFYDGRAYRLTGDEALWELAKQARRAAEP